MWGAEVVRDKLCNEPNILFIDYKTYFPLRDEGSGPLTPHGSATVRHGCVKFRNKK